MALKKEKTASGGEVGEVSKKPSFRDKHLKNKKRKALLIIVILPVCILSIYAISEFRSSKTQTQEEKYTQEFLESDNSDATKTNLVDKYGTDYDKLASKILHSNPAEWDKSTLNDAYAALLYADKMGAYTQVDALLGFIEAASNNGLDIDKNNYGINQEIRDSIAKRARDSVSEVSNKTGEVN